MRLPSLSGSPARAEAQKANAVSVSLKGLQARQLQIPRPDGLRRRGFDSTDPMRRLAAGKRISVVNMPLQYESPFLIHFHS